MTLTPLATTNAGVGASCTFDGRPAIVCSFGNWPAEIEYPRDVLIRYTDGNRERILADPWECAVECDS